MAWLWTRLLFGRPHTCERGVHTACLSCGVHRSTATRHHVGAVLHQRPWGDIEVAVMWFLLGLQFSACWEDAALPTVIAQRDLNVARAKYDRCDLGSVLLHSSALSKLGSCYRQLFGKPFFFFILKKVTNLSFVYRILLVMARILLKHARRMCFWRGW